MGFKNGIKMESQMKKTKLEMNNGWQRKDVGLYTMMTMRKTIDDRRRELKTQSHSSEVKKTQATITPLKQCA